MVTTRHSSKLVCWVNKSLVTKTRSSVGRSLIQPHAENVSRVRSVVTNVLMYFCSFSVNTKTNNRQNKKKNRLKKIMLKRKLICVCRVVLRTRVLVWTSFLLFRKQSKTDVSIHRLFILVRNRSSFRSYTSL